MAGKGLEIYTAEGKPVHTVELHGAASNCGFGEPDGKTLFITGGPEVLRLRLDAKGAY